MRNPIVNLVDAPVHTGRSGNHFEYSMSALAGIAGARSIGANVTRVPPGKAAFPFHHHRANEEHFFVLSGSGALRAGDELHEVKKYDYLVSLPGGPEEAHQLINTGTEELVYLAFSTVVLPEVVGYPDSGKTGVRISVGHDESTRFLLEDSTKNVVGYWDGEDGRNVAAILARRK